jgi:hypothetical protein
MSAGVIWPGSVNHRVMRQRGSVKFLLFPRTILASRPNPAGAHSGAGTRFLATLIVHGGLTGILRGTNFFI